MITAVVIENFKGIGERFRLPIRQITLLFGPNSAGKSTLLQAMHYAREVLERHNLDAHRTTSAGPFVELGGFRNFVHKRDVRRQITLRFELTLQQLPKIEFCDERIEDTRTKKSIHEFEEPNTAAVEFSIAWNARGLYVSSYCAELDGVRIGTIRADVDFSEPSSHWVSGGLLELNFEHPILQAMDATLRGVDTKADAARGLPVMNRWEKLTKGEGLLEVPDEADALPDLLRGLSVYHDGGHGDSSPLGYAVLDSFVSRLMVGPAICLWDELERLRYLGPFREAPARDYSPPPLPDPSRWTNGLAAWDVLHASEPKIIELVSDWLSSEKRLGTGYGVRQRRYNELDFDSDLRKRIISCEAANDPERLSRAVTSLPVKRRVTLFKSGGEGDVVPQDVGVGISQLLPIVVACLEPGQHLTCIEQPELHLHPRLQCELGDLLIVGALGQTREETYTVDRDGNEPDTYFQPADDPNYATWQTDLEERRRNITVPRTIIVETHSEHLILRLQRRIRDTTRGEPHDGIAVTPDDISVCYVSQEDGQSVPRTMHINDHGDFIEPWPDQFFEHDFYERFS